MRAPLAIGLLAFAMTHSVASSASDVPLVTKVEHDEPLAFGAFGAAVDVRGDVAAVSATRVTPTDLGSDFINLYEPSTGALTGTIEPDAAATTQFGMTVALGDGVILVSEYRGIDISRRLVSDAVGVFDLGSRRRIATLTTAQPDGADLFGSAIDVAGDVAVITAPGEDVDGLDAGAAYLFNPVTGAQLARLAPEDAAPERRFGSSAAIDGNHVVVGAPGDGVDGASAGSAYVFDLATGEQVVKLVPDDGSRNDLFGGSVAIHGNLVAVGASGYDADLVQEFDSGFDSGAVYLFDLLSGGQVGKLTLESPQHWDGFGWSVALDGGVLYAGAIGRDVGGADTGAAYAFDAETGELLAEIVPGDASLLGQFSYSGGLAADDGSLLVSSNFTSSAYLYDASSLAAPEPTGAALALLAVAAFSRRRA